MHIKTNTRTGDLNSAIAIITLNANGLIISVKKYRDCQIV